MKKIIMTIAVALMGLGAFAQNANEFYPGWYLQVQGGAGETAGEAAFKDLISPAAALGIGYQFTPVTSLRGVFSGWQGKGALPATNDLYKYNFGQFNLDGVFDICNMFNYKSTRVLNPFVFAGIGANVRFNNDEAQAVKANFPAENYLWDATTLGLTGRAGLGLDIRLGESVALNVEVADNVLSDHFNSKVGDAKLLGISDFDFQLTALAGLKFRFGAGARRRAAEAAAAAAAAEAAAKAAAEKAAAEAAAKAAAEKAAAEAAARAAAEKAAAEAAARAAAEKAERATVENVYFSLDKWDINDSEVSKIDNIIRILKKYPDSTVSLSGYADKFTGTAKRNMKLSMERAAIVKQALIDAGIAESRITSAYYGDTEQVSEVPELNRVTVCVMK